MADASDSKSDEVPLVWVQVLLNLTVFVGRFDGKKVRWTFFLIRLSTLRFGRRKAEVHRTSCAPSPAGKELISYRKRIIIISLQNWEGRI